MKATNKETYLNVLFDNSRALKVVKSKVGLRFKETVFEGLEVVAERIITPKGVKYFVI